MSSKESTKVLFLEDEIGEEYVKSIIIDLSSTDAQRLLIYVDSPGGNWTCTRILMDYIERNFESVEIVVASTAMSSAWRFLNLLKNVDSIELWGQCYALDHLSVINSQIIMSEAANPGKFFNLNSTRTFEDKEWWVNICDVILGYNADELSDLKAGKDLYFDKQQMETFLTRSLTARKEGRLDWQNTSSVIC